MDFETLERPAAAAQRSREVQQERVAALLEEQRRREERVGVRRRVRGIARWPEARDAEPWRPSDP
jgi:hypothetical protein